MLDLRKAVADRHTLIKDETVAWPFAFFFRHGLQIFQYAALQVVLLFKAAAFYKGRRLFAAYAARAEHRDLRALSFFAQFLRKTVEPGREFAEAACLRINGALECADRNFIGVPRVDEDRVQIGRASCRERGCQYV